MPAAAILFDLDGTLVDSEHQNIESVALALRRLGAEMTEPERAFVVGHSWNEIYDLLRRGHGLTAPMDEVIRIAVEEKRRLVETQGHRPLTGAVEAVTRLARRQPLAVVSGASRAEVHDAIRGLGLEAQFRLLLGAEDYRRGKPAPDPYASAIRRLGVLPGACIAVEDATPGIRSARAAGARVVGVRAGNFAGFDLSEADAVVDTLHELTDDLLERLLQTPAVV
jgi:HAD superfamily hydrolase (TIGR01509 family)